MYVYRCALQGLVNRGGSHLFFNAGLVDFDWPGADEYVGTS
jgi:hypothetical protein